MKQLTDAAVLARLRGKFAEMISPEIKFQHEFRPEWIARHGWLVVPAESAARLPKPDLPRLAASLQTLGCHRALAANTDMAIGKAEIFEIEISVAGLHQLNQELGPYRFLLTVEARTWAIACNEWYNLFAAPPGPLQEMLGRPIEQARAEYDAFAALLGEPLASVGHFYAEFAKTEPSGGG